MESILIHICVLHIRRARGNQMGWAQKPGASRRWEKVEESFLTDIFHSLQCYAFAPSDCDHVSEDAFYTDRQRFKKKC